jgi:hypothetical protein
LALTASLSFVLFLASLAPVFIRPGPPILLGVSERLLLVVYAAWLVAVSVGGDLLALEYDGRTSG